MVATRRGTRVGSPDKNASDETSEVAEPTPSTRRTRQRTVMEENQSQSELTGDSMPDEPKDDSTAPSLPATTLKRETRRSRHHLADKKQADSTHEADVSESESCCSVVSDMQATPRTRRRAVVRDKPRTATAQDEASEAESCSSSVSATRSRRAPRSLRKRALVPTDSTPATKDDESGVESCSSVVSLSKVLDSRMITRSHSKVATAEAAASEPESCSSCVSGLQGSTVRRSARNQRVKPTEPIPLNLEESTDIPSSPVSTRLRDRRGKTKSGDEEEVYDSEGCKSGPCMSPWRSSRHQARVGESDSESVPTDVCTSQDSPSPLRGRGTPCSSRTGSASSNRAAPVTRARSKAKVTSELDTTPATVAIMPEKDDKEHEPESVPESDKEKAEDTEEQLDSTMTMGTSETQECTMIEDTVVDLTLVLDEDELDETSAGAEVEMQEPQNTEEQVTPVKGVTVSEPVEDSKVEKQTNQKETVTEMSATITEDREQTEGIVDVAVNNKKPEIVNADQAVEVQACSEPLKEDAVEVSTNDPEPAVDEKLVTDVEVDEKLVTDDEEDMRLVTDVVEDEKLVTDVEEHEKKVESEKGVIVIEGGNDDVQASLVKTSATLSDDEQPSSSSHAVSTTTEHKGMISLLDSSEDEESADEGLSADEEAGPSQADEDMESEEEITCPDESQSSQSNGLFVIDTKPGVQPDEKYYVDSKQIEEEEDEEDFVDEEGDDDDDDEDSRVLFAPKKPLTQLSSSIDPGLKMKQLGGLYISFDGGKPKTTVSSGLKTQKYQNNQDELLKNSVIVPDLEKKDSVPPYKESNNAAKLKRKAEREKTTGEGWFNMRAPELTEELKNDLKVLQMRSAMDPKRFYKKNDREGFPKYFQVGTVVDSPVDFYNSRIPKKQRKRTIVEELLADAEFRSYNKKKYQEIMVEKAAHAAGKKNKKKNKFHKKK